MAFTYNDALATDRDKVRFALGDVSFEAGPRPADANFSDAEIAGLITAEGTWQRAVAAGFERLAAEWMRYPSFKADGFSLNRSDIAKGYQTQAHEWRRDFPRPIPITVAGQITVDGYSDDVASDDVDTDGGYDRDSFRYVRPG
jgi:hypothetical protein